MTTVCEVFEAGYLKSGRPEEVIASGRLWKDNMTSNLKCPLMKTPTAEAVGWLGLDAHAHSCVLAWMDEQGKRRKYWSFPTSEPQIIKHLHAIPVTVKHLALEEGGVARWIAQVAKPHVTEVVVCDPGENFRISRHHHKCDYEDAYSLAHLHRLGALKEVWQPQSEERAIFKCAAQAYLDAVDRQTAIKLQVKAHFRQWGVIPTGREVYNPVGRCRWLAQLKQPEIRNQMLVFFEVLDNALAVERKTRRQMTQLGRKFPEVALLRTLPGVGPIGAHMFVAFVQEPKRFEMPQQLFRYCRLGIRDRSSDGKPLGYQKLDRAGHGVLKALSYRAWLAAAKRRQGAVYQFYRQSLERTGNEVHARLNTQRKILHTMLVMWEKGQAFDPKQFLGSATQLTAKAQCG